MTSRGRFIAVIPDEYVEGLEILEEHLIVDTKEETTAKLEEKLATELNHLLVVEDEGGTTHNEYYRVSIRGTVIEEQNTMTAIMASICLYIAFILISAVGTILAIQSLSDSTKYKYRYQTLQKIRCK